MLQGKRGMVKFAIVAMVIALASMFAGCTDQPARVIVIIVGAAGSGLGFALLYTAVAALLVYGKPGGLLVMLVQLIFALAVGWPFLVVIVWILMLLKWPAIILLGLIWLIISWIGSLLKWLFEAYCEIVDDIVKWFSEP